MTIATDYIEGIEDGVNDLLDVCADAKYSVFDGLSTVHYFIDDSKLIVNEYNDMSAE